MIKNKKYLMKLTSIILAAAFVFSALHCSAAADDEYENIVLNAENFILSGKYSTIDSAGLTGKMFTNSVRVQRLDGISARFYIEEAGTYLLWFLTGASSSDEGRAPKVTVDEETFTLEFSNELAWKQAAAGDGGTKTWSFDSGWHTVNITTTAEWKPFFFNALYITNDPTAVPDPGSDDGLKIYTDNTVPEIDNSDIQTEFDENGCSVKFPPATDENTVIYEYTVGEKTEIITDIAKKVNIGRFAGETVVTFKASDKFGNFSQKKFTVTYPGGETSDGEHILLSGDNFTVPDYGAGNGYTDNGGTATGNLFPKSVKIAGEDSSKCMTARIFIKEAGAYNLWVLSANELDSTNSSFASRVAKAGFDGEYLDYTPHKVHIWEKQQWELSSGWHTLNVGMKNSWGNVKINAVYITSDTDEAVDTAADDGLLKYYDNAAPIFESKTVSIDYSDSSCCKVRFPDVRDENGVAETLYYINGELTENTDGSISVTGLKPLERVVLKAEAYDKAGNKAALEENYISSPIKTDSFSMIKNGETEALSDLSRLSPGDVVKINTSLSNRTENEKVIELSLCLYSADYERMLLCAALQTVLGANAVNAPISVSLQLPNAFDNQDCIIAATLWDKASKEPYITGIEIKGAAQ